MTMSTAQLAYRSPKLGDVPYEPDDVVHFPDGLPGFEDLRQFLLVSREECEPIVFLASLENADVTFPLVPATLLLRHVGPAGAAAFTRLTADTERLTACYSVVSISPDAGQIRANLRAPVVIDLDARRGRQVILPDETLPLSAPIGR
jgi:flagellar assembly factor FliW